MSDSDADDSGFDREAERKRLREKYENEQEDREQTQRMSELLLQGATMTNMHCDTCGNPIFRFDGQEFCPVCQQPKGGESPEEPTAESSQQPTPPDESSAEQSPTPEAVDHQSVEPSTDTETAAPNTDQPSTTTPTASDGATGDIEAARASLTRTLTRLAQQAEAAEDVRRTKEYLQAAQEAAATLAELNRL